MNDAHKLAKELVDAARALNGPARVKLLNKVGVESKTDVDAAVRADIGDLSMSGWRRNRPISIQGRYDVRGDALTVTPQPRSRGPLRVLESGRNAGVSGRRSRRRVGPTRGKGTWTDATKRMESEMPELVERAVLETLKEVLGG